MVFKIFDDLIDIFGKCVLVWVDLNVLMDVGKVMDSICIEWVLLIIFEFL